MNKITYLDGARFHRALVAGINNVVSNQESLNKINVFPVPDGDTGTNMVFTLTSILDTTSQKIHPRVDDMLTLIADAALDGARGNSGVILAQFFQGISDGSAGVEKMDSQAFSKAIKFGAEYAREALAEPKEGTILTVLTDFSNHLIELLNNKSYDFEHLLEEGILEAEKSLMNTPNLLPILKKSGVVDAGGQGFVDLLNGILNFVKNGDLKGFKENFKSKNVTLDIDKNELEFENSKFRYCTECLITGDNLNHKEIRENLQENGDSLVVAGSKKKAKIHIHVNEPSKIFKLCANWGNVQGEKADDMWQQQEDAQGHKSKGVAIVTDSGADLPDNNTLDIHVVPLKYNFGEVSYIDKLSQTTEEFYSELLNNSQHPQTSQPTPGDFRRQYQFLQSHYDSIISIHLPHEMSGTYQSALNAAKRVTDANINIVDSLSASVGLGLIVLEAAKLSQDNKSHEEISKALPKIISNSHVYLAVKDLSYIVKGGRLPAWVKKIADFLRIRPILTTKDNGKMSAKMSAAGILKGTKRIPEKLSAFILNKMEQNKKYNILIGHCNTVKDGQKLLDLIKKGNPNINSIELIEIGCALGVHAGPGSLAVGLQSTT